jgi:hypothetical protein
MTPHTLMHVQTNRDGVVSRRTFLRTLGAGAALGTLGWKDLLTLGAQELQQRGMACILLFMRGGPSQFETFDPKPGHANGGPTRAIQSAVPGIRIAEGWQNVARQMEHLAIVRSMTNREGEHQRAVYQMHTGYLPLAALRYPSLGSIVVSEIGPRDFDLPSFVSIGGNPLGGIGSGFLGMAHAPFVVRDPRQMPANAERAAFVNRARFDRRLDLLADLESDFAQDGGAARVRDHRSVYDGAARLVRSPRISAFELRQETNATRARYGDSAFGQGCLLARRLVEAGVTFVEVDMPGWDTHQNNFELTRRLGEQADAGFAALIQDLRDRNRLDRTLVIWLGEFGRTPRINANTGRDHYPRAFSVVLAGAGIRGGRVIGGTSDGGNDVTERPVRVADLFCTFCRVLGIDPRKENVTPIGRPIRLVDGGEAVGELFA